MSGAIEAAEAALNDHRRTLDPARYSDADRRRTRALLLSAICEAYPDEYGNGGAWSVYVMWLDYGGTVGSAVARLRAGYADAKARRRATPPEFRL